MTASFSCPQCKATFSRSAHLRRHQRTHRPEKPYVCQFCSVASSRKDVIVRHTRNFHPDAAPKDALQLHRPREYERSTQCAQDSASSSPASEALPAPVSPQPSQGFNRSSGERQLPQPHSQLPEMDNVSLEYAIDFNSFDFQGPDLSGTTLDSLAAPPLASSGFSLIPCAQFLQQSPRVPLGSVLNNDQGDPSSPRLDPSLASHSSVDADYASAQANLALYDPNQTLSSFRFPSKNATHRFVNAFFKHMAPHMPIVHQPTFAIASVASPLLIEIMACGALYLCERNTAVAMHAAAQQLMFQVERTNESHGRDPKFQPWILQTYLLMSYFGAYGGNLDMQQRATHVFPYAIKLAQDAIKELDQRPVLTYKDWVYQETLSRSIACAIEIGAALASTARDQCFTAPFLDASFPLPSDTITWQQDEINWRGTLQQQDSCQALDCIFAGQKPAPSISELGLVTLISSILWRVCSFEALIGSHHLDLCTDLVERIDRATRTLDVILKERTTTSGAIYSTPRPLLRSAKALLNSVFYHFYGSKTLTEMKRLLDSPDARNGPEKHATLPEEDISSRLNIALVRAAEALQSDCQLGVNYVQRMAPHQIGPICATACYEGGLLLSWYLMAKSSLFLTPESTATIDQLIDEVLSETEGLYEASYSQRPTLPLEVSAELLSDRSVWQWPCAVSEKLKALTKSSPKSPFPTTLQV